MDIQQNSNDIVVKNEETSSGLVMNDGNLKQEPSDQYSVETCHNIYDSLIEVVQHELCENSLEIKHTSHSIIDKQKPSQATHQTLDTSTFTTSEQHIFATNQGIYYSLPRATNDVNKVHLVKTELYEPIDICQQVFQIEIDAVPIESINNNHDTRDKQCINTASNVCSEPTCDAVAKPEIGVLDQEKSLGTNHLFDYQVTSQYASGSSTPEVTGTKHNDPLVNDCGIMCRNMVAVEYSVKRKKLLVKHIKSHSAEKLLTCNLCPYICKHNSKLVAHMRIHSGEKPFVCTLCHAQFKQNSHLMRHMRKIHSEENPYCCTHCDYKCSHAHHLKTHIRTHTDILSAKNIEPEHTCIEAASGVKKNRVDAKTRQAMNCAPASEERPLSSATPPPIAHTSDTKLQCNYCSYTTVYSSSLLRHMRAHTGEKRFTCSVCGYKCSQAYPMKLHMRAHNGEEPFTCIYCDYKSFRPSDLKKHVRIHMGVKPFACSVCEYRSADRSALGKHMDTHRT